MKRLLLCAVLALPMMAQNAGVRHDGTDCPSGQHVNGYDATNKKFSCSADSAAAGDGILLADGAFAVDPAVTLKRASQQVTGPQLCASSNGSPSAMACTVSPAITTGSYAANTRLCLTSTVANTGAFTLSAGTPGAVSVKQWDGSTDPVAGAVPAIAGTGVTTSACTWVTFNGSVWILDRPGPVGPSGQVVAFDANGVPAASGVALSSLLQSIPAKNATVRLAGYEVGAENGAALATVDLTSHAFTVNDANAKTLTEASCISDAGSQAVTVKIGSTTLFSITCVAPASYSASTTDGSTGYIVAASMGSTAVAAHNMLDLSGTANTTTKDVKLHIYATVN